MESGYGRTREDIMSREGETGGTRERGAKSRDMSRALETPRSLLPRFSLVPRVARHVETRA